MQGGDGEDGERGDEGDEEDAKGDGSTVQDIDLEGVLGTF